MILAAVFTRVMSSLDISELEDFVSFLTSSPTCVENMQDSINTIYCTLYMYAYFNCA